MPTPPSLRHLRTPLLVSSLALLFACLDGASVTPSCAVSAIQVSLPITVLTVGQSVQADATYSAQNCSPPPALTWTTDSAAIVTVSSTGLVTAAGVGGPVLIRASAAGQSGSAAVTVNAATTTSASSQGVSIGASEQH